jgi:ketosteroid isomerase-like protein
MTSAQAEVERTAHEVAAAIGARDIAALRTLFDDAFVHRAPGGASTALPAFLEAVAAIPGDIVSVALEDLVIDVVGDGAIATGIQRAEVRINGELITERRGFVDWFVRTGDGWRIRVAVDLPAPGGTE